MNNTERLKRLINDHGFQKVSELTGWKISTLVNYSQRSDWVGNSQILELVELKLNENKKTQA